MNSSRKGIRGSTLRGLAGRSALAAVAFAAALALGASVADARVGGGSSFGSRGARTYSAPAPTNTAPRTAQPMERTMTQPGASSARPSPSTTPSGGLFGGGFGRGLMGGLMGGLLGAGLFGLLSGSGLFGGMGGIMSIFGLLLQIGLVVLLVRWGLSMFRRRQQPAMAGQAGPRADFTAAQPGAGGMAGFGGGASAPKLDITPRDFSAFEQRLGAIQQAYSDEDLDGIRRLATPEMASYFAEQVADNAKKGVVNKVSGVKLLQGDLSEAWREDGADYATVAMRFSLVDVTMERSGGRVVSGDATRPQEVTEVWTFRRPQGADWVVSAIQQV